METAGLVAGGRVAAGLRASGRIKGWRNSLLRLDGPAAVQKLLELCPYLEVNRFQSECEEGGAFATAIPTFTDVSHDSLWGSTSNWTKVSGEEPVVTVAATAQQPELLPGAAAGASAGGAGDGSSVQKSAIFLDVDGVLHPLTPKGHPVGADIIDLCDRSDEEMAADARKDASFVTRVLPTEFKRSHMEQLKRIVDATGAEIILSSTWREMPSSYAAVTQQLALYNIPPPTGATPVLVSSSHVPPTYRGKRGVEIMLAMEARPHLDAFVVLDDSDFTLGSDTLTTERFPKLDPEAALTAAKADAAIAILKVPFKREDHAAAAAAAAVAGAVAGMSNDADDADDDDDDSSQGSASISGGGGGGHGGRGGSRGGGRGGKASAVRAVPGHGRRKGHGGGRGSGSGGGSDSSLNVPPLTM